MAAMASTATMTPTEIPALAPVLRLEELLAVTGGKVLFVADAAATVPVDVGLLLEVIELGRLVVEVELNVLVNVVAGCATTVVDTVLETLLLGDAASLMTK